MSIIIAILIFGIIVFIHELGHFFFARRGGVAVEEFSVGMGPKIFGFHHNGTDWNIRLLPIGGFCRMYGEDGAQDDDDDDRSEDKKADLSADLTADTDEKVDQEERSQGPLTASGHPLNGGPFYEKSVWVRILAVFGGPLFNFILALFISFVYIGLTVTPSTVVATAPENYPAYEAGIREGDQLIAIDGHRLLTASEARIYINVAQGDPVDVTVKRTEEDGSKETLDFTITPTYEDLGSEAEEGMDKYYLIGITYGTVDKTVGNVIKQGFLETASSVKTTIYSLGLLLTHKVSVSQLSGPVGIVDSISQSYTESVSYGITAILATLSYYILLLSANLGVMNLLPIPALDGGRLVFLFVEAIRGKPLAPNKEGFVHFVGFALLMVLMVFVLFNDLHRIF